ncbi:MAG: ABC transporter substrate-binding protein [Acetobacteraceae bacterium]
MTLGRRLFHLGGLAACGLSRRARAAESTARPPFRIVMLLPAGWDDACSGFRDYLGQHGIPAELIVRDAANDMARIAGFVQEINATRPDLVYVSGTVAALAALGRYDAVDPMRHITGVPALISMAVDPAASGIVRSLTEPGRNVTGVLHVAPVAAQLRSLGAYREYDNVAVVYHRDDPDAVVAVRQLRELLAADDLTVLDVAVSPEDPVDVLADALRAAKRDGADWLYLPPDPRLEAVRMPLTVAALQAGLASFASTEPFLTDGKALAGLVCRRNNVGVLAGRQAGRILLQGQSASQLPFRRPNRFVVLINMETARTLELFPPMTVLRYAEVL